MEFQKIGQKISGNVVPVPAQFNDDGSLNLSGYTQHVNFLIDKGVRLFYLALSASQFDHMTMKERLLVTRTVCDLVKGKGIVLAQPVGGGWIDDQVAEGKAMKDAGADVLVVKPVGIKEGGKFFSSKYMRGSYSPERHNGHFIGYMEHLAQGTGMPLVYHDKPFSSGLGLSMDGLEQIVAIDNVVGMKVHVADPGIMQMIYSTFKGRIAMFDGFGKTLQFWSLIWGATARHTCWSWFDPVNDQAFYDAVVSGEYPRAIELVNREWPLAHAIRHTGFRGYNEVMRFVGLPGGPVRIPGEELSSKHVGMIEDGARQVGLIK